MNKYENWIKNYQSYNNLLGHKYKYIYIVWISHYSSGVLQI